MVMMIFLTLFLIIVMIGVLFIGIIDYSKCLRFTIGPRPMNVYLASLPWRLVFCLFMVLVVYLAPM